MPAGGARILREAALGGRASTLAETAVIEEQHRVAPGAQRRGERSPVCAVAGITVEHDHGEARTLGGDEPSVQPHAIRAREAHFLDRLQSDPRGRQHVPIRKVHQPPLPEPDRRHHHQDDRSR